MTISSDVTAVQSPGNGSATVFAAPMKIFAASDVIVGFVDSSGTYVQQNSGYSVSNIAINGGCTITFAVPPPLGITVDIRTLTSQTQGTEFANLGAYLPESTTDTCDRIVRMVQDLARRTYQYGIHGPDIESVPWPALPKPSDRAGGQLMFDPSGLPEIGVPTTQPLTGSLLSQLLTTAIIAPFLDLALTAAETAAGVTPVDFAYPAYNVKRYGAALTNTSALNLAALNAAISVATHDSGAAKANGVVITIPADCHYGYNFLDASTWPQINSGSVPILVVDYSQGDTYDTYPTRYDGTQVREFIYSPQTTTSGQHNGNGKVLYGNWHPYYMITNTEVNNNPTTGALDNLRASLFFGYGTNYGTWRIGQGTLAGANLVPSQLLNFTIAMYPATQVVNVAVGYSAGATSAVLAAPWGGGTQRMACQFSNSTNDVRGVLFTNGSTSVTWNANNPLTSNSTGDGHLTIGIVAGGGGNPLICDFAAAGNLYYNTGTNTSTANYHFKQPVTDFNVAMWESLTTVCDVVYRNSTGASADVTVRNNGGNYELLFPGSATPCVAINGTTKVQQITGPFYPATPAGGQQANSAMFAGTGAPSNSNGNNGDIYFNAAGGSLTTIYQKRSGSWVGIV